MELILKLEEFRVLLPSSLAVSVIEVLNILENLVDSIPGRVKNIPSLLGVKSHRHEQGLKLVLIVFNVNRLALKNVTENELELLSLLLFVTPNLQVVTVEAAVRQNGFDLFDNGGSWLVAISLLLIYL